MLKLVRYLLAIGALYAPVSLVWAADPVCVETGGRKICYSAAADRVTPQTFDLSMRGMCHVATDTGAVTEWTGSAYISSATCPGSAGGTSASSLGKAEDAAHSSGDTGVAILVRRCDTASVGSDTDGDYSVPCVDASGKLWTSSIVDSTTSLGSAVTGTGAQTAVQGRSHATAFVIGSVSASTGSATVLIQVSNDNTNFITACTITLSLTTSVSADGCGIQVPWRYIRMNVSAISGTNAAVTGTLGG